MIYMYLWSMNVTFLYLFEQAKEDILHSVQLYGTEYANVYERGLNSRWIDVYENEGKRSGAYSSGQRVHPFCLDELCKFFRYRIYFMLMKWGMRCILICLQNIRLH